MTIRKLPTAIPVLLMAALCLPAIAAAQMPPGGGRPHDVPGKGIGPGAMRADMGIPAMISLADQLEEQLGLAREALKLAPAQMPPWREFEMRALRLAGDMQRWKQRSQLPIDKIAAPQAVERQIDISRNHLTALEDLSGAVRPLYEVLSDAQKIAADQRLAPIVGLLVIGGDMPAALRPPKNERRRDAN